MFEPKCLIPGTEIENVRADFRTAKRIEQYRVGETALYMPEGLRWNYIPLAEIQKAEEGIRVLPGGHCNPIRAKKPELEITTASGKHALPLDRPENLVKILNILRDAQEQCHSEGTT